ncbi:MAG: hypothetical protein E6F98_02960 [Actinobacteria bacterium]|nr:MAG: hypothetical protein E6F98_02960 [Actinomycetota bacterium]
MHLAAVLKSAFALGSQQCTPRQIGPGQHVEGGTRGAACLLAAFRDGCRPAKCRTSSAHASARAFTGSGRTSPPTAADKGGRRRSPGRPQAPAPEQRAAGVERGDGRDAGVIAVRRREQVVLHGDGHDPLPGCVDPHDGRDVVGGEAGERVVRRERPHRVGRRWERPVEVAADPAAVAILLQREAVVAVGTPRCVEADSVLRAEQLQRGREAEALHGGAHLRVLRQIEGGRRHRGTLIRQAEQVTELAGEGCRRDGHRRCKHESDRDAAPRNAQRLDDRRRRAGRDRVRRREAGDDIGAHLVTPSGSG